MADYRVDREEALRYLGYAGQPLDAALSARVDELFAAVETQSAPQYMYRVFELAPAEARQDDGACESESAAALGLTPVGSGLVLPGEDIAAHLEGATHVALLCATLGLANERAYHRLSIRSAADAALFSAGGSSLVEDVADAAEAAIAAEAAAMGLRTGGRFSPGYGDLPLSLQPQLLGALGADKRLGVTANDSFLMTPMKSVTAIVGLFPGAVPQAKHTCAGCVCADHCTLRKVKPCYR